MLKLGVNVDHVATLREARGGNEPDPVWAANLSELAGAQSIVAHLREDRRHIKERDLRILIQTIQTHLNLEMSCAPDIVSFACKLKPYQATLVPERRQELTTEGGLDVVRKKKSIRNAVKRLKQHKIVVSLFVDPEKTQIKSSKEAGADFIELHTGKYALSKSETARKRELDKLTDAAYTANAIGLRVNAGHGLNYLNVGPIVKIPYIEELNIGHSIVSRSVFAGLFNAVREMLELIKG